MEKAVRCLINHPAFIYFVGRFPDFERDEKGNGK